MSGRNTPPSIHVIVDTPRGSRNKFKFDPELQRFRLAKVLPAGMSFPYDFGYIPETKAEDGDPLDVLILMDAAAFPGCLVECRLIGVLQAEQRENEETVRNDRLIGVADAATGFDDVESLRDLNPRLVSEIEQFFVSYNAAAGKKFTVLGRHGPQAAWRAIRRSRSG